MAADYNGARSRSRRALGASLRARVPLLLDGATGTELERRGVRSDLPLWSSWGLLEVPDRVRAIHADYLRAGVDVLTAATFRTHARSLAAAGLEHRAAELGALAVRLARDAVEETQRAAWVLGSAAPLEDCYHPERVPPDAVLAREHASHARHLARAGVDAILVETMNTGREAVAATRAARDAGADACVSFVCAGGARLLSGEPLAEALEAVAALEPLAVGVNCLPPHVVADSLPALSRTGLPFLVYANLAGPDAPLAARHEEAAPERFAAHALGWARAGAAAVGGCCGTTPEHLAAVARRLRPGGGTPPAAAG